MTTTPGEGDPLEALAAEFGDDKQREIVLEHVADALGGHGGHDGVSVLMNLLLLGDEDTEA